VDELAKKYEGKLRIGKLDVDANGGVTEMFGVQGIPTLILFKGGKPVQQVVGYRGKDQLEAVLVPHLELEKA
jgi:thioredoxin 1